MKGVHQESVHFPPSLRLSVSKAKHHLLGTDLIGCVVGDGSEIWDLFEFSWEVGKRTKVQKFKVRAPHSRNWHKFPEVATRERSLLQDIATDTPQSDKQ